MVLGFRVYGSGLRAEDWGFLGASYGLVPLVVRL